MASTRYSQQSVKGTSAGYGSGAGGADSGYNPPPAAPSQLVDPETIYTKQNIIGTILLCICSMSRCWSVRVPWCVTFTDCGIGDAKVAVVLERFTKGKNSLFAHPEHTLVV